ncbi:tagaturonate reductase [Maribacter sp. 2307ULW6-5]|uniref:tagaturonate reductase n=1 Tax=Maribacter sp. 2307ULW6-5 TaxID=3386275 RepID=UPI0039BC879D
MQPLNRKQRGISKAPPIKVLQFGEGNFLRAFVGQAFQRLNSHAGFHGGIAVVQPIPQGKVAQLKAQEGLYTLFTQGIGQGERVNRWELITNMASAVNPHTHFNDFLGLARERELQFIISNTTESGIAFVDTDGLQMEPPTSFPAKLTRFLWERFVHCNGAPSMGVAVLPCELIDRNADRLRQFVLDYVALWELPKAFVTWLEGSCTFHNTLVDRIVPGYPRDNVQHYAAQLPYADALMVTAEPFFLWVIEGDETLGQKLPFAKTEMDVRLVQDLQPYRTQKVRILNGAHTAMVPVALMHGNTTVRQTLEDDFMGDFVRSLLFKEVLPTLPMPKEQLMRYADAVLERFGNPYLEHQLGSIALNSVSKFKVRVLPSLLAHQKMNGQLPVHLLYAFAALLRFYQGHWKERGLPVQDGASVMDEMKQAWRLASLPQTVAHILEKVHFWGQDLSLVPQLGQTLVLALGDMEQYGIAKGFHQFKTRQQ